DCCTGRPTCDVGAALLVLAASFAAAYFADRKLPRSGNDCCLPACCCADWERGAAGTVLMLRTLARATSQHLDPLEVENHRKLATETAGGVRGDGGVVDVNRGGRPIFGVHASDRDIGLNSGAVVGVGVKFDPGCEMGDRPEVLCSGHLDRLRRPDTHADGNTILRLIALFGRNQDFLKADE